MDRRGPEEGAYQYVDGSENMSMKACRNCRFISKEKTCPNCRGTDLGENYSGLLIVLDIGNSELARKAAVSKKGRYALRVR